MYYCGTLKPVKVILRRRMGKRENNRGSYEPNWCILHTYMEKSQQNPDINIIMNKNAKKMKTKRAGGLSQVTKCLPRKCQALSLNPSTTKSIFVILEIEPRA
jgi:hypothetical protein